MASLPIGSGPLSDVDAYLRQHSLSVTCADHTLDHLSDQINVWHQLIRDLRAALEGTHDFEVDGKVHGHRNLAMRLEVVALSTAKAALDCCLGGLYVQGFMLTRHLHETWQRVAYTFLYLETTAFWLSPTGDTPRPPNQNTISRGLLRSPLHKSTALRVEQAISNLNVLAHPTHGVITAHDTLNPAFISLGGAFQRDRARELIRHATAALMFILQEHRRNMIPSVAWQEAHHTTLLAMRASLPELGLRLVPRDHTSSNDWPCTSP